MKTGRPGPQEAAPASTDGCIVRQIVCAPGLASERTFHSENAGTARQRPGRRPVFRAAGQESSSPGNRITPIPWGANPAAWEGGTKGVDFSSVPRKALGPGQKRGLLVPATSRPFRVGGHSGGRRWRCLRPERRGMWTGAGVWPRRRWCSSPLPPERRAWTNR